MNVLSRTSGNTVVRWSSQVLQRRPLAGELGQGASEEVAERFAGHIDVAAVARHEVHGRIQNVVGVALEPHAGLEDEGEQAAAIGVGIGPDMAAIAAEAAGLALDEGRVGEERGGNGLQGHGDAHLADHVGFRVEIQIDLHGAGAGHHVRGRGCPASACSGA